MNNKILYLMLSVLALGLFTSCDEEVHVGREMTGMTFSSSVVTKQPVIEGSNVKFHIAFSTTDQELSELIPIISTSVGAKIDPASGTRVDFSKGPVIFTVTAGNNLEKRSYNVSWVRDPNPDAQMGSMTFADPLIISQPEIIGTNITFVVDYYTTDAQMKELVPTIEASSQAVVVPASGSKVDFSKGPVKFTVTSGNGKTSVEYNVTAKKAAIETYDMEGTQADGKWECGNPNSGDKYKYYYPVNMSTCNPPIPLMMLFGSQVDRMPVTQATATADIYSGKSAAKIETLGTKGNSALYPKVVSGTLFLGKFETDPEETLKSTKFGIPYTKKPLVVRGFYKYTPGQEFHNCPNPQKFNVTTIDANKKDECAINAIIYEIEGDDAPYITGVKTYDDERIIGIVKLADGTAKAEYTPFSLKIEYKKPFDPNKQYRFAIICTSSRWGETFSGAPSSVVNKQPVFSGSTLWVDDIEVLSEEFK